MKAIKNYTTDIPIEKIIERLQRVLGEHGARQVIFDYGDDGKIYGVQFVIRVQDTFVPVKLPARVDKAQAVLKLQYEKGLISRKVGKAVYGPEHAYKVAWRNILDWVEAQMALLDIEMAKLEEIFLPYVVNKSGKTLFEVFEQNSYQLPGN